MLSTLSSMSGHPVKMITLKREEVITYSSDKETVQMETYKLFKLTMSKFS